MRDVLSVTTLSWNCESTGDHATTELNRQYPICPEGLPVWETGTLMCGIEFSVSRCSPFPREVIDARRLAANYLCDFGDGNYFVGLRLPMGVERLGWIDDLAGHSTPR